MGSQDQFDQPSAYRIRLKGKLDPMWEDWFPGFIIAYTDSDTLLNGIVADQAALHGVIAKIRDLGLAIQFILSETSGVKPG